jgi:uncharacterized protein (DUF58 family)
MSALTCFDVDFLTKLERLSLVTRGTFRGSVLAHRRSRQSGCGVEFADHREYGGADDFRYLDWNLFARQGRLMVKRFQEEQDLHVYLLVDSSRSMGVGRISKFDYGRRLAASLAYIALADLDRAAVMAFSSELGSEFPMSRGKDCILSLLQFLDGLTLDAQPTHLARAAEAFTARPRRPGLVIVISDWLDRGGYGRALDHLRHQGHEVHVVQLYDPTEAEPEALGDFELIEVERGLRRRATIDEKALRRYRALFQGFCAGLRSYCHGRGMACTQSSTATSLESLVLEMMRASGSLR